MNPRKVLYTVILMVTIIFMPGLSFSQNVEVEGKAKITIMDTDESSDQIVVKQMDGTLAVRSATSLVQGPGDYGTVVNPITGKVWLDRNLGATQVATSSTDAASYGDLYQWGRAADGHQLRTSATQNTQATTWLADEGSNSWDGEFIIGFGDWLSPAASDLWSGTAAENNPCPSGYRVPTNAEWNQERLTWSSDDAAGAFASPLKLPLAGARGLNSGSLIDVGAGCYYWSSTVISSDARILLVYSSYSSMVGSNRANGYSIRCIKD